MVVPHAAGHPGWRGIRAHPTRAVCASGGALRLRNGKITSRMFRWVGGGPCHPARRRPGQSRADRPRGVKVVRPVGRSTLTPRGRPA